MDPLRTSKKCAFSSVPTTNSVSPLPTDKLQASWPTGITIDGNFERKSQNLTYSSLEQVAMFHGDTLDVQISWIVLLWA